MRKIEKSLFGLHFSFDQHHDVRTRTTTQDRSLPQRKYRQDNVTTRDPEVQKLKKRHECILRALELRKKLQKPVSNK